MSDGRVRYKAVCTELPHLELAISFDASECPITAKKAAAIMAAGHFVEHDGLVGDIHIIVEDMWYAVNLDAFSTGKVHRVVEMEVHLSEGDLNDWRDYIEESRSAQARLECEPCEWGGE